MATHRIVGISFDHMHMGDLLRLVQKHPDAEIVGVFDPKPDAMMPVVERLEIPEALAYTDFDRCLQEARPTVAIVCSATGKHADWTEKLAARGIHVLVEKPFAASLAQADRMIAAAHTNNVRLAINWPLVWNPVYRTMKRLIEEGTIGQLLNLSTYGGNRGPLKHLMDKLDAESGDDVESKRRSWFYQREQGGGSMLDYIGYGVTLGTWFFEGKKPIEVTATVDQPHGLDVDEHSVTVARYDTGLSKFETRWGTFTDPWTYQPQPKCGFVACGSAGTISAYDYEPSLRVQTAQHPEGLEVAAGARIDTPGDPNGDPVSYFLYCLDNSLPIEGPLSTEISRIGQQIVDTAYRSAHEKRTLPLEQ